MLHIILLILKIIGIILAVILGLIVLVVGIVLFVPLRYRVQGKCMGDFKTLRVRGKATWLLHLIRADVSFQNQKLKWRVCIAWKKIMGGQQFSGKEEQPDHKEDSETSQDMTEEELNVLLDQAIEEKESKNEEQKASVQETESTQTAERLPEGHGGDFKIPESPAPPDEEKNVEPGDGGSQNQPEDAEKMDKSSKKRHEGGKNTPKEEESLNGEEQNKGGTDPLKDSETKNEIGKEKGGIFEKLAAFVEKIKCTIDKICAKIKELAEKKEKVVSALEDETHIVAVGKGKKELFRLLRVLKPKKCIVNAMFGFQSPHHTGQALAVLAVLYPFLGEDFSVTPDFEKSVFKGTIDTKGHIRLCHFAAAALRLVLCRAIRQSYRDVRGMLSHAE